MDIQRQSVIRFVSGLQTHRNLRKILVGPGCGQRSRPFPRETVLPTALQLQAYAAGHLVLRVPAARTTIPSGIINPPGEQVVGILTDIRNRSHGSNHILFPITSLKVFQAYLVPVRPTEQPVDMPLETLGFFNARLIFPLIKISGVITVHRFVSRPLGQQERFVVFVEQQSRIRNGYGRIRFVLFNQLKRHKLAIFGKSPYKTVIVGIIIKLRPKQIHSPPVIFRTAIRSGLFYNKINVLRIYGTSLRHIRIIILMTVETVGHSDGILQTLV